MVHHEEHIGSDISLSNLERSTDQVVKPLYKSGKLIFHTDRVIGHYINICLALSSWEGVIEEKDLEVVEENAPLMRVFGYKPEVHSGEYNQFKSQVSKYELFKAFLQAEIQYKYKPRFKSTAIKPLNYNKRRDYKKELDSFRNRIEL